MRTIGVIADGFVQGPNVETLTNFEGVTGNEMIADSAILIPRNFAWT